MFNVMLGHTDFIKMSLKCWLRKYISVLSSLMYNSTNCVVFRGYFADLFRDNFDMHCLNCKFRITFFFSFF